MNEAVQQDSAIHIAARPHMPEEQVAYLSSALEQSTCFLEYGAGGSTRLAAKVGVPVIYSVESDPDLARNVRRKISQGSSPSQVHVITTNIGATGDWGYPVNKEHSHLWPEYPVAIWDRIERDGAKPDLILIDGRFRVACFLTSLLHAPEGARILFDDYRNREERYRHVESYTNPVELVANMGVFVVPASVPKERLARDIARYCTDKR